MNQNEIVIYKLNSLIIIGIFILLSVWSSLVITIKIAEITQAEINGRLTKISHQLEMFEEAVPTGKEVIYLDEDLQDWLNDNSVTGYTE